jgi:hypothetical protein
MPVLFYVFWIAVLTASMTLASDATWKPVMRKIHPQLQHGSRKLAYPAAATTARKPKHGTGSASADAVSTLTG